MLVPAGDAGQDPAASAGHTAKASAVGAEPQTAEVPANAQSTQPVQPCLPLQSPPLYAGAPAAAKPARVPCVVPKT